MVAANANSGRPAIIYSRLLTKLKADLPKKIQTNPRNGTQILSQRNTTTTLGRLQLQRFLQPTWFRNCARG